MYSPTDRDRLKLEMLAESLNDLDVGCGCGENEGCSECNVDVEFSTPHISYDTLEIRVRLRDLDTKSKLARLERMNDDFADALRQFRDLSPDELETHIRAGRLMLEKTQEEYDIAAVPDEQEH